MSMNNSFFSNNRPSTRRSYNQSYGGNHYYTRQTRNSMNFTDNFVDYQPDLHNSTMRSRNQAHLSRQQENETDLSMSQEKPSFSSLFASALNFNDEPFSTTTSGNKSMSAGDIIFPSSNDSSMEDDGVYLQISNLDQYYDESSLRHYLMNQLKPITPILSLTIETPSIAKVKVPSVQFAKQVVSHLHRKKMGHKRIFVSFLKDKTSAECSALRNKVIGLLRDVPTHQLPMSKFRELYQSRFKTSISILDLYRMPDICSIGANEQEEKIITLHMDTAKVDVEVDLVLKTEQHSAPYCIFHYKPDKNKGWAEIEIEPLPNVYMSVSQIQSMIHPLMREHQGDIPIASVLYCLEAELDIYVQPNDRGVSFEHLISCVPNVQIRNNDFGIKTLAWRDENFDENSLKCSSGNIKQKSLNSSSTTHGDMADTITKEVVELIRMCPKSTMQFSKFIPTYHNHFGKQCRVADYGCTKLIEMFEAMSSIVQVLGEGDSRHITLTHSTQLRRFANDVFKILRSQPSRSVSLSKLPQAFMTTHNHGFNVTDYGVCDIEDLLDGLRHNNFIVITKTRDDSEDYILSLQKRRQTNTEFEKTCIFAGEVVDLLRNAPQYSIPFRKFVRSYHYYFGYQCKLSDYGYMRLAELLEALSGVVEMDNSNEENRKIFLSRKVALRIFSEQIQEIIKTATGKIGTMMKVDELMELHKNKYGYQMHGSSLGYDTVIDALKFVPFIELSSYENELWLVSHLENQKFRQRAMLACLTIVDIGNKVPLTKFHAVFSEKFKFNIHEKSLYAMKHAVDIEMVNGVKMISLSQTMKFLMHISNVLEQRKVMNIQDIKANLKLNLTTCFNFGHPNLSSLLQAYPDIFNGSKVGVNLHECSDMKLAVDCPFSTTGLQKLLVQGKVQVLDEKPEMYRTHTASSQNPIGYNSNRSNQSFHINNNSSSNNNSRRMFDIDLSFSQNVKAPIAKPSYRNNQANFDITMPTEYYNAKEQPQQQRFTNQESNQSFYERNLRYQQQQNQMQAMKQQRDFWNNSAGNSSGFSNNSSYSSAQMSDSSYGHQSFVNYMMTPFGNSRFQDPLSKPDTPPSSSAAAKPTAIWFDPVWKCDNGGLFNNTNINSGSESLKSFNVHVVSPFMSFKTMFTFDNVNSNNSSNNMNNNNQNM